MMKRLAAMVCLTVSEVLTAAAVPLTAGRPENWQPNKDGGDAPAVSAGEPFGGAPSVRFEYKNGKGYGNSLLDRVSMPPEAYGVAFKIFVRSAAPAAAMHLWLHEKDGDMWMCPVRPDDLLAIGARTNVWRDVFVPFSSLGYQPRGDKKKNFLSIDRLLMGFNYADQSVCVAGLSFLVRGAGVPDSSGAAPAVLPKDPPGRRIAVLREPSFGRLPGHAEPERLAKLLSAAGYQPVFVRAADLCDASRFNKPAVDLLVLPNAPFFPQAAVKPFRSFLKAGGAFFSIGGYAFDSQIGRAHV